LPLIRRMGDRVLVLRSGNLIDDIPAEIAPGVRP